MMVVGIDLSGPSNTADTAVTAFRQDDAGLILILAITFTNAISVGILLTIPAALTLGRDIANNTRASRECLLN